MKERSEEENQETLDAGDGLIPRDVSRDQIEALALYRVVDGALRGDPGLELPVDFADRVTRRVLAERQPFAWFEYVVVPILVTLLAITAGATVVPLLASAGEVAWQSLAGLIDRWTLPSPSYALAIALALGAAAALDRLAGSRI